ncbi:MAG: tol-pal system protein YbgF [Rhodospirillaceae bacterium]|jgi:tol-pal system protein YbgF|nr:tol-pal system protein YbgF [Rhodospirillaceae bacterium]MBT5375034.1 tol-pal system protein YbgF [Rhodospirillaceae bacterium]MBT5659003.1 tol-pal system protein YbgF [Rhodospirillaceae bacterium]MBT5751960.1 tol-pal system protein YbgF [Rhodospirillaceae bacterium]
MSDSSTLQNRRLQNRWTVPAFRWLLASVFLSVFVGIFAPAMPAGAQDSNLRPLVDKLSRLERDLTLLQRQVYGEKGAPVSASSTATTAAAKEGRSNISTNFALRMETRFNGLDQQMREITGKLEDMAFRVEEMNKRVDLVSSDFEYRLSALEQGGASVRTNSQPQPNVEMTEDELSDGESAPYDPNMGEGVGTLGTVRISPDDAVAPGPKTALSPTEPVVVEEEVEVAILPEGTPNEQYEYSLGFLWQSNYGKAEGALKAFLAAHPDHPLAGNAQYWLGETYYVRKDYTNAAVAFAEGFERYADSPKAPDNLLKLSLSLAQIDEKDQACRALGELQKRYPDAATSILSRASKEREKIGCK